MSAHFTAAGHAARRVAKLFDQQHQQCVRTLRGHTCSTESTASSALSAATEECHRTNDDCAALSVIAGFVAMTAMTCQPRARHECGCCAVFTPLCVSTVQSSLFMCVYCAEFTLYVCLLCRVHSFMCGCCAVFTPLKYNKSILRKLLKEIQDAFNQGLGQSHHQRLALTCLLL